MFLGPGAAGGPPAAAVLPGSADGRPKIGGIQRAVVSQDTESQEVVMICL